MLNVDFQGWHVWQDSAGRIVANGPNGHNRELTFASIESACRHFEHTGRRPLAAAIAYGADVGARPDYHDGTARPAWERLADYARASWERNPTPRFAR